MIAPRFSYPNVTVVFWGLVPWHGFHSAYMGCAGGPPHSSYHAPERSRRPLHCWNLVTEFSFDSCPYIRGSGKWHLRRTVASLSDLDVLSAANRHQDGAIGTL
jgi:hypothetical protein